jgi:hypothetical protein
MNVVMVEFELPSGVPVTVNPAIVSTVEHEESMSGPLTRMYLRRPHPRFGLSIVVVGVYTDVCYRLGGGRWLPIAKRT